MKFKAEATDDQIAEMEKALAALPARIPEIKEFVFGRDVIRSERSYDFALVSAFNDLEAMQRYQVHPDHQQVVSKVRAVSESILAVDFHHTGPCHVTRRQIEERQGCHIS
jgi:hypothetical protein